MALLAATVGAKRDTSILKSHHLKHFQPALVLCDQLASFGSKEAEAEGEQKPQKKTTEENQEGEEVTVSVAVAKETECVVHSPSVLPPLYKHFLLTFPKWIRQIIPKYLENARVKSALYSCIL